MARSNIVCAEIENVEKYILKSCSTSFVCGFRCDVRLRVVTSYHLKPLHLMFSLSLLHLFPGEKQVLQRERAEPIV